jgi:uncharacterized OB-fold protein
MVQFRFHHDPWDGVSVQGKIVIPDAGTVPLGAPISNPFTETYWEAARDGRLLVRRCHTCGNAHHPPRPACPICWSADVVWEEAAGVGTLYSFSVIHENDLAPFSAGLPYVVAVVELAEGPHFMTTIIESDADDLHVGAKVSVVFVDRDGVSIPAFRVGRTSS